MTRISRMLRSFLAAAFAVSMGGCGPLAGADISGEVVWSSEALTAEIARQQPNEGAVVRSKAGSLYRIPQVEGSTLSHLRSAESASIWSFYLLKDQRGGAFVRLAQPLSLGVAVKIEFGDLQTKPPEFPARALELGVGEIYTQNAECRPSELSSDLLSHRNGSLIDAVNPLEMWRQRADAKEQMSCSRTASEIKDEFSLVCNASITSDFGVALYSFVTDSFDECKSADKIFDRINNNIYEIVSKSRVAE